MANRGATQEKLTAYLRCGMAHFALDEADTRWYIKDPDGYEKLEWKKVFEGAIKSIIKKGWSKKRFKIV